MPRKVKPITPPETTIDLSQFHCNPVYGVGEEGTEEYLNSAFDAGASALGEPYATLIDLDLLNLNRLRRLMED